MKVIKRLDSPNFILIIRLLVGWVFLSEGIQKFLFQDQLGVGRFMRIGIPFPEITAYIVGAIEIISGICVLLGLYTRLTVVPLIFIMLTAIATTKIPILVNNGIWNMLHEARTDFSMLLGSLFLFFAGSGKYSIDNFLLRKKTSEE